MVFLNAKFILLINLGLSVHTSVGENKYHKYSADANEDKYVDSSQFPTSLRDLDLPFRMAKLNVLWVKAKNRLTDSKLQSIFSDLKIHDKEEIAYKHFRFAGKDSDGLEEARLRQKLIGIMSTYDLLEHFADTEDPKLLKMHKALNDGSNYVAKDVFNDIRLNKLWAKAEMAGFTDEELETLKQEFQHHQEKVDEYISLLKEEFKDSKKSENILHLKSESWNELEEQEELLNNVPDQKISQIEKADFLREKYLELRNGIDRLDRLTAKGPNYKEFIEPKVQGLWKTALEAKFSPEELASLKEELLHYESRLLKLRHLHAEEALEAAQKKQLHDLENSTAEQHIKKHIRTVQKLHMDLETKIMQKHTEL
ncbi:Alpha-2-macroglobulin receptor-associated protein [Trachymyrmex septentrionalis]|uniref:Alpha-2-macroglobulin receptor-associated protein n=1 Tax=Trachymyrmex septentrionalis TaxID=34720 RepID=A0A195FGS1_9HYME|nr:PREDICTED: alpha-2-macroglobulin receptor-associated protein [Trachymyrmex septentrionalis]KYN39588.1 Alpha-2-macroglobulin receptor-associated protein [Trachymyrmex septentrionalis]